MQSFLYCRSNALQRQHFVSATLRNSPLCYTIFAASTISNNLARNHLASVPLMPWRKPCKRLVFIQRQNSVGAKSYSSESPRVIETNWRSRNDLHSFLCVNTYSKLYTVPVLYILFNCLHNFYYVNVVSRLSRFAKQRRSWNNDSRMFEKEFILKRQRKIKTTFFPLYFIKTTFFPLYFIKTTFFLVIPLYLINKFLDPIMPLLKKFTIMGIDLIYSIF